MNKKIFILILIILAAAPCWQISRLSADSWYEQPDYDMESHPLLELYAENGKYITGKITAPVKKAAAGGKIAVKITSTGYGGKIIGALGFDDGYVPDIGKNKRVLMSYTDDVSDAVIVDSDRSLPMEVLFALFVLSVLLVGGLKKIWGLAALALSAAFIALVFIPLSIRGYSPLLLAAASVLVITASTVLGICGPGKKSLSAMSGTFSSVAAVLALGMIYYPLAHIEGFSLGPVQILNFFSKHYLNYSINDFRQLMLGILIIGSTGMIIDVAVCISSTLEQIIKKNPAIAGRELVKIGMSTGREIAGPLVNSLILAYFGAELIPLISDTIFIRSAAHLFNSEWFFITAFQAFAGSLGILVAVPMTSLACAWLMLPRKQ